MARAAGGIFNVGEPDALTELEWARTIAHVSWDGEFVEKPDGAVPPFLRAPGNTTRLWVTDTLDDRLKAVQGIAGTVHHRQAEHCAGQARIAEDFPLHRNLVVFLVRPSEHLLQHPDLRRRVRLRPGAPDVSVNGTGSSGPSSNRCVIRDSAVDVAAAQGDDARRGAAETAISSRACRPELRTVSTTTSGRNARSVRA